MKQKFYFTLIIVLTVIFIYITNIYTIPQNIILFEDEEYEISVLKGIKIEGENISTQNTFFQKIAQISSDFVGDVKLKISAFGRNCQQRSSC